ncbi:hypothetical protein MMC11_000300 [Xylographa trunciseda]|nr:hypothetical protein [Xylographa trunciseda]
MVQQCVIVGSVVGTICGVLLLVLTLAASKLLYDRRSRVLPEEPPAPPRTRLQEMLDRRMTPFYPLDDVVDKSGFTIEEFHWYGLNEASIGKQATELNFPNPLHRYPARPFDEVHILEVMRSFGPVVGQEPPERLLKLLKTEKYGTWALLHFIHTTLVSSIMLEARHIQLLCPPVAFFLLYASTAQPKSRKFVMHRTCPNEDLTDLIGISYYSDMAKLRKLMVKVLPYPNAGPERAKLKEYMSEILLPFWDGDEEYLSALLELKMQGFAKFGNMLLLESTSWEWDYSHNHPYPTLVTFPAFRQVRDSEGEPQQGEYDVGMKWIELGDDF